MRQALLIHALTGPVSGHGVALDVTDTAAIDTAVRCCLDRFGQIDVLVNNAGYGYRSAVEEGDPADVDRLFATNFFGPVALIKAVLPGMRARRRGTIVNLSSIAVRITPAGSGYYAAVKGAMEGLSGSLRKELAPLGISVIVVEPGGFRTDFGGRSLHHLRSSSSVRSPSACSAPSSTPAATSWTRGRRSAPTPASTTDPSAIEPLHHIRMGRTRAVRASCSGEVS